MFLNNYFCRFENIIIKNIKKNDHDKQLKRYNPSYMQIICDVLISSYEIIILDNVCEILGNVCDVLISSYEIIILGNVYNGSENFYLNNINWKNFNLKNIDLKYIKLDEQIYDDTNIYNTIKKISIATLDTIATYKEISIYIINDLIKYGI